MNRHLLLLFITPLLFLNGKDADHYLYNRTAYEHAVQHTLLNHLILSGDEKQFPVIPGDFPDPSIIRNGDMYLATGTSSEWAPHFPLYQSTDLLHWQLSGYVFDKTPEWASSSFWAPELFYRNETYYVYYVARRKSDGVSCIGVATTKDLKKGFTDRGVVLAHGKEAIDPFVIEDNGELYITWKAYGLENRPIEILGCRLSDDGLLVTGEPFMLLRDDERKGLEGQCIVKRNNFFYLLYSVGDCCGRGCSYQVRVARSSSLKGNYTNYEENPILSETADWKCTGHGTVVTTKEGKDFYLFHAYNKSDNVYTGRQGMLGQVTWNNENGWPSIKPVPGDITAIQNFKDAFLGPKLSTEWQWDFRNSQPHIEFEKSGLILSGTTDSKNLTGTALTVRPFTGNYEITTAVANHNMCLKGLVVYGDANQSVGIGIKDNTVQVWEVKNNKRSVLQEASYNGGRPVYLKIKVESGYRCKFYWSNAGKDWNEIKTGDEFYNGDFLSPWDRSARPGIFVNGDEKEPACFSFFNMVYF